MKRRGFALSELLVALVIAGIIGIALARLVINQSRFVAMQDGVMRARSGARSALNVMLTELRMVTDNGLRAASRDSITIRVPVIFGIACGYTGGRTVVGVMPADSASYAGATIAGMAWRDTLGTWQFVNPSTLVAGASTSTCTSQVPTISVLSLSNWTARAVSGTGVAPTIGSPVYFYQLVTYVFAASADLPGRRALWRAVPAASLREELVAPFDTSAHFDFIYGKALTVQTTAPAVLDSVMGVRVRLIAASENAPAGRSAPTTFDLSAKVYFRNHVP